MSERLSRYGLPLLVAATLFLLVVLAAVYRFIDAVTAIKGAYVMIGVAVAAVAYRNRSPLTERVTSAPLGGDGFAASGHLNRWANKAVMSYVVVAFLFVYVTNERLLALIGATLVGFTLVVVQWIFAGPSKSLVGQILVLYTVGPVTRYLSTGFYFGSRDILGHTKAIQTLLATGRIGSIDAVYSTYSTFPALHVVSASVSAITGLPAYDSLMFLGAFAYLIATAAVIYLVREILSPTEAIGVGIVFGTLSIVQNYASYFYPQAFATAAIVYFLYVTVRSESAPASVRFALSVASVMAVVVLALSHHVSQILFTGVVIGLLTPSVLSKTDIGRRLRINAGAPRPVPLLLALTAGLTYLVLYRFGMVTFLVEFVMARSDSATVNNSGGIRTVLGFGTEIPYQGIPAALRSLVYVDGLYFIGLTALFVLGALVAFTRYERYARVAGYVLLGGVGSLFVLKTPLLNVAKRLALPLSPFFAVVAGIGLAWGIQSVRDRLGTNVPARERARQLAVVGVVLLVAVTGPLVAADDIYDLHRGPNLWESYSTPEQQVDFSQQELAEIQATVQYLDGTTPTSEVSMLSLTRDAFEWFEGVEHPGATVTPSGIRTENPFVYRTAWTEHQIAATVSPGAPGTLSISDWWLNREVNASNKVYTTGSVGVVEGENETVLSANESRTR